MTKHLLSNCKAKDPSVCRYHSLAHEKQLVSAVQNNDYAAYEAARDAELNKKVETSEDFIHDVKFRNVKKMPAVFVIDREAHAATQTVNEKAAWIFEESSKATIKRDGTSVTVTDDGQIFARRAVKKGKTAPAGFIAAETDSYTGHTFGLEPINQSSFNKMFTEAAEGKTLAPGTYELCGPKINGNPENLTAHKLLLHGADEAVDIPDLREVPQAEAYELLKNIFVNYKNAGVEGVVWWGADGKRAKLRVKDFFGDPQRR